LDRAVERETGATLLRRGGSVAASPSLHVAVLRHIREVQRAGRGAEAGRMTAAERA
jgi:hypothetical protein